MNNFHLRSEKSIYLNRRLGARFGSPSCSGARACLRFL